jgi:hypothetical protein
MMQNGDLQPQAPAFPKVPPAELGEEQRSSWPAPVEEQEPVFVSPPPLPWPRVFPGL